MNKIPEQEKANNLSKTLTKMSSTCSTLSGIAEANGLFENDRDVFKKRLSDILETWTAILKEMEIPLINKK